MTSTGPTELADAIAALERLNPVWHPGDLRSIGSVTQTDDGHVVARLAHGWSGEDDCAHPEASVQITLYVGAVFNDRGKMERWENALILFRGSYQGSSSPEYSFVRDYVENCPALIKAREEERLKRERRASEDEGIRRRFFGGPSKK